jgi:hypothetical protein
MTYADSIAAHAEAVALHRAREADFRWTTLDLADLTRTELAVAHAAGCTEAIRLIGPLPGHILEGFAARGLAVTEVGCCRDAGGKPSWYIYGRGPRGA